MPKSAVFITEAPKAQKGSTGVLSHDDIRFFSHALTSARGQFTYATKALCTEFGLGPRGPWIIGLVGREPLAPHALASLFDVGRSLITAELNKLVDAGLIVHEKDKTDGRRVILSLTPAGRKAFDRLGDDLDTFMAGRLSGHSRDDIMRCAQILTDFARGGQTP